VVPCSFYFDSKLIITITELRYAAQTLIAIGSLVVPCSLVFFTVFSRTVQIGFTKTYHEIYHGKKRMNV